MSNSIAYFPPAFLSSQFEVLLNSNIAIFEQFLDLIPAHNKNCLILESQALPGPFVVADRIIKVDGDIFEGDLVQFESPIAGKIVLTAKDEPSVLEFKTTATGASAQEIAEDIARALNDSVLFNRYYVASAFNNPAEVTITALEIGSKYTLSFSWIGAFIPVSSTAGTDENRAQQLDNYGAYIEIFTGQGSYGQPIDKAAMCLIGSIEKKYNSSNKFELDVTGVLKDYITSAPPDMADNNLQYFALLPFVAIFGESYSISEQFRRKFLTGTTAVKWAAPSALGVTDYDITTGLTDYVVTTGASDICFLTNQPASKDISLLAKEAITVIVKAQPLDEKRTLFLTIIPTFLDGTAGAEEVVRTGSAPIAGAHTFVVSPESLPLSAIESAAAKKLLSYTLQIRYATTFSGAAAPLSNPVVTKSQEFYLIENCDSINLLFLNRLGYYDGIELAGEAERAVSRNIEESFNSIPCRPESKDFIRGLKAANIEPSIKTATTYLNPKYSSWLYELAATPEAYVVNEDNSLTAVVITGLSFREDVDKNKVFAEVEFIYSAPYNFVTK